MYVRTITLGVDPDASTQAELETKIPAFFDVARARVAAAGRELRSSRVVLPVLNARPRHSRANFDAVIRWIARLATDAGVRWLNVPFTTFVEGDLRPTFDSALEIVRRYDNAFVNFIVADNGCIQRRGILETARFIQSVARLSRNGYDNFRVGASCNIAPGSPFFPFTHHAGEDAFALALELPSLFLEVLDAHAGAGLVAMRGHFVERLVPELRAVDALGLEIEAATGLPYRGTDASLAPYPDATGSVARIVERLGVDDYGSSGTLFITAFLTDVLRQIVRESGIRSIGFNGVMDSLLEDPAIARGSSRKAFGIDALLSFASVCGCGLDMVPVPGDTYEEEIASLILDVAAMSVALDKPLGARILPIPGKHANEYTDFGHDFFYNCRIMAVRNRACARELFDEGHLDLVAPRRGANAG